MTTHESSWRPLRVAFLDADGTLLGANGSVRHSPDGERSVGAIEALHRLEDAGVERVLMTGRDRVRATADARTLGMSTTVIYELGSAIAVDGVEIPLVGQWGPLSGVTTVQRMNSAGVVETLLHHFPGVLEPHTPWSEQREYTLLLRGRVDLAAADEVLGWNFAELRLVDNGVIDHRMDAIDGPVHAYHVVAASAGKAKAVAHYRALRGLAPDDCVAVGNARVDLEVAPEVGRCFIVANGPAHDDGLRHALETGRFANAITTRAAGGDGVEEAVSLTLGASR